MITTKNSRVTKRSYRRELPLIMFGAGLVLVFILLISFWPMTWKAEDDGYIKQLDIRMAAMETRLNELTTLLERYAGKNGTNPNAPLEKLNTAYQRIEASFTLKSNLLAGRLDKLEAEVRALSQAGTRTSPEPQIADANIVKRKKKSVYKTSAKKNTKFHVVAKGDTAYSISRRYNLSLHELKELNRFTEKTTIYPGQKIIVSP